ncbi:MAG TPA: FecR family protein [Opitutaceae bacterium]|jgi:hypothetical protein|nr:FecR family protein [Opitutaceae bacterium]
MKKPFSVCLCLASILVVSVSPAADLKQSKFTQVVNEVRVISAVDNSEQPAVVNAVFHMPDLVRTGDASRAELVAADDTITRVGANTVFSFDPANRTIDLQQGSLLFHSPKGKGGGTIHTGSATASVLGTTIIVTTTPNGGFKVIDLEGHVAIKFLNGLRQSLNPGQMTFVLPGGHPAPIINIRLDKLTHESKLVQGFVVPLPSMPLIQQQIDAQIGLIQSGKAQDTGLLVGDLATTNTVQVVTISPDTNRDGQKSDEQSTTSGDDTTGGGTTGGGTTGGGGTPTPPAPPTAVTINSSTLDPQYIFSTSLTFGSYTFPAPGFLAPSNLPNIAISTPTIDLSPYGSATQFGFLVPNGTLTINNSLKFTGLSSTATLNLFAQNFSFASGSTIEADVGLFNLEPQTATTLTNVTILDNFQNSTPDAFYGEVSITSPTTLSLVGSTVQGSFVTLDGVTGISITNGSAVKATFGNVSILDGGGINISGSTITAIQGLDIGDGASTGQVDIAAVGGTVNITGGTTISAATGLTLSSDTGISISGASSLTSAGSMFIEGDPSGASAPVSITGNSILTTGTESNLVIQAGTALTVNGATFNADPVFGSVYMSSDSSTLSVQNATINSDYIDLRTFSTAGSITVQNTAITTNNLNLNSDDGILLDCNGLPPTGTGSSPQVNLVNSDTINGSKLVVQNTDFTSFPTVNMTAHTINLTNVNFGGTSAVNFYSNVAMLNVGSSVAGKVNFISNVTYGGNPAQNYVPIAQGGNWSSVGAPINITAGPY